MVGQRRSLLNYLKNKDMKDIELSLKAGLRNKAKSGRIPLL